MLTPFSTFDRHFAEFDRIFGRARAHQAAQVSTRGPRFNVEETDEAWRVHGLLPGWSTDALDIQVEDGVLTISGEHEAPVPEGFRPLRRERGPARFRRSLRLHDEVDVDAITARAKDGVLTVTLPRKPAAQPRRITVETA